MKMLSKRKAICYLLGMFMLTTSIALAQEKDVKGSKDHPLISRFRGSIIKFYDVKQFDEYILALAKVEWERDEDNNWVFNFDKSKKLEGKVTRIQYDAPEDRSTLEIYRNYESALKRAGFEILFAGEREELGKNFGKAAYNAMRNVHGDYHYWYYLHSEVEHQRYIAAKLSRPEGDVYVSVFVSISILKRNPVIQVDFIEVKPMETGLVTADTMMEDITRTGRVAIYGIYFDTDRADIKPDSEPTLEEIARLLRQNPDLSLYVVGHTDDVGALDYNMNLSQRRAKAVVESLVSRYGIDPDRLHPIGVGPSAPAASNETEEGRARNRRVELVKTGF
ncbi:MAG: OmpA family protein [Thermotogota bacterium]|nr:OmpA family protein [Thermotogota bacterium]